MIKLFNDLGNIALDDVIVEGRGRHFVSRFIEAGLVSYGNSGVLKLTKETIDKFLDTFIGCPVVLRHRDIKDETVDDIRAGVVSSVYFNMEDGWYYCEGIIWGEEVLNLIETGWTVSCSYKVIQTTGESGEWHNMLYDDELVIGAFEHLAIVPNPRYEDATILLNSKDDKLTLVEKFKNLFNKKKIRNSRMEELEVKKENESGRMSIRKKIVEHAKKNNDASEAWESELRAMLDELETFEDKIDDAVDAAKDALDESERERENEKEDERKDERRKDNRKKNEEDDDEDEDNDRENLKTRRNSKDESHFKKMKKLSNSAESFEYNSGYESEITRLERGKKLF